MNDPAATIAAYARCGCGSVTEFVHLQAHARPDLRVTSGEALRDRANARKGKMQRLDQMRVVTSGRAAIGKVLKRELQDRLARAKEMA